MKISTFRITFSLFSFAILTLSCVGTAVTRNFNNYDVNKNGLIIGTITFPKEAQWFDEYTFRLNKENGGATKFEINSYENVNSPTPADKYIKTYIFILEKAPGKYSIDDIEAYANDLGEASYFGKTKDVFIPIEVRQGEITYVGDILYKEVLEKGFINVSIVNSFDRDIKYFNSKYPNVDWRNAKISISQTLHQKSSTNRR